MSRVVIFFSMNDRHLHYLDWNIGYYQGNFQESSKTTLRTISRTTWRSLSQPPLTPGCYFPAGNIRHLTELTRNLNSCIFVEFHRIWVFWSIRPNINPVTRNWILKKFLLVTWDFSSDRNFLPLKKASILGLLALFFNCHDITFKRELY